MASIRETILAQSFARIVAAPAYPITLMRPPRRTHLTAVKRDNAPTIHQIDGDDDGRPGPGRNNDCAKPRDVAWRVAIYTRGDESGHLDADTLMLEVLRRLNPATASWPAGITLEYGAISYLSEIADEDAMRMDIAFTARYQTPAWQLDSMSP